MRQSRRLQYTPRKGLLSRILLADRGQDAKKVVYTCKGCQFFAHNTNVPANELQTIPISWSFAVWGLDMVGPFKKAPGGITHLFVCIDKFSKCIEAKQVVKITAANAKEFMKG